MLHAQCSRRAVVASCLLLASCFGDSEPEPRTDVVVVFTGQSTDLDPAAAATLDYAVRVAKTVPRAAVTVAGYADRTGSPQANQILSRVRAQVVADSLVAHGIAHSRVRLRPRNAAGGDPGAESRRVEVRVGE